MAPTNGAMSAYRDLNRFSREDKDMSRHTKAPWSIDEYNATGGLTGMLIDGNGSHIGSTFNVTLSAEAVANARRIVACVNALEGLTTEQIEEGVFQKMREHRDFLAEEVDAITKQRGDMLSSIHDAFVGLEQVDESGDVGSYISAHVDILRAALAKAKGGAA